MARQKGGCIVEALIEGELSATESYRQALRWLGDEPELRRIESDHRQAAGALRERSRELAPSAAGAWNAWGSALDGAAAGRAGRGAALDALQLAEEHGIREYERALEAPGVPERLKTLIASTLLPQARSHLPLLGRMHR